MHPADGISGAEDDNVLVRAATPADYRAALDVLEEVAGERTKIGAEPPIDRDATRRRWLQEFAHLSSGMFVALLEDRVVGVVQMLGDKDSRLGMYACAAVRGQGIGTRLLETALEWARDRGTATVSLEVWPDNVAAIDLYERFGFERTGYHEKRYSRTSGELWDSLEMTLDLKGSRPWRTPRA